MIHQRTGYRIKKIKTRNKIKK
uniref:Ribosomal protein S19 n=1 Tax=Acrobeloides nanus TaxID=290746 RepID=A0A914DG15_9BILA